MINGRRIISAVICGLLVTVSVRAGMIPVVQEDTGRKQTQYVCDQADFNPYGLPHVVDLDSISIGFLPEENTDFEQTSEVQHLQGLTNGPGSLNLCLSALIGLGLCSSAHFIKKISFGFIPEWYHNGGPSQIGHSFAVSPDSLCPVPVYCFIQPVLMTEDSFILHRWRTVVSIWRKSQYTPTILVPRGPPNMS